MSTLTVPNSFSPGQVVASAAVDANFTAIVTWSTNIDSTNIGSAGLLASVVRPATFGGATAYTFPAGLNVTGALAATGAVKGSCDGITAAYVPPGYTAAGAAVASVFHIVQDQVRATGATTTVTLTGAAVFTSSSAFTVHIVDLSASTVVTGISLGSGSAFTFNSTNGDYYNYTCVGA